MKKVQFITEAKNRMTWEISGYSCGYTEVYKGTQKMNGIRYNKPGTNIAPTVYVENVWREEFDNMEFDNIIEEIAKGLPAELPEFDLSNINIDNIVPAVTNEKATEFLKGAPQRKLIGDIILYYRIIVKHEGDTTASFVVRDNHLATLGVKSEQELYEIMLKNMDSVKVQSMTEVLQEMMGGIPVPPTDEFMYVARTTNRVNHPETAAVALLDKSGLRLLSKRTGQNIYILPSSVYELLYIVDNGQTDAQTLAGMVGEVNTTQVAESERLSGHVFLYNKDTDEINVVA